MLNYSRFSINMAYLLGIRIDEFDRVKARKKVVDFLSGDTQHTIYTPNPEMLVAAYAQPRLKDAINRGSLNIADGKGITLFRRVPRIQGVDFLLDVCVEAERLGKSVYLLGSGSATVLLKTTSALRVLYPKLDLVGRHEGPTLDSAGEGESELVIEDINHKKPDVLLVAFGHGKQELWIDKNLPLLPSVKIAMGVGGSFDFISGMVKRAPKPIRTAGFEWLWRLIVQPWRIKRIFIAVIVFPILCLKNR